MPRFVTPRPGTYITSAVAGEILQPNVDTIETDDPKYLALNQDKFQTLVNGSAAETAAVTAGQSAVTVPDADTPQQV